MRFITPLLCFLPAIAEADPISVLTGDLNSDGIIDRAELIRSAGDEGMADLKIYTGSDTEPHTISHELVWVGGIGQQPELALTEHGSLRVYSMNMAIGRNRWEQILTIAWRNEAFVLAGFTYGWYDTLNLQDQGSCDVNLLSGKGELFLGEDWVHTVFSTNATGGPIDQWEYAIPPECGLN